TCHSTTMIRMGHILMVWLEGHAEIIGVITGGEARCRLRKDPELIVGLDLAFFQGAEHVRAAASGGFFDGPPRVAIEILPAPIPTTTSSTASASFSNAACPEFGLSIPTCETSRFTGRQARQRCLRPSRF